MSELKMSDRTREEIAKFFMRTSIPRIFAKIEAGELTWEELGIESKQSDRAEAPQSRHNSRDCEGA